MTDQSADQKKVVYLHVGAPKTGTTYLQDLLWRERETLARDGVYPGEKPLHQWHAALDLLDMRYLGHSDPKVAGAWEHAASGARSWHGSTAVISHELLAYASAEQAREATRSLDPAEVHVVYTARDLARQIPAVWQESIKNRKTQSFDEFLRELRARRESAKGEFWGAQDAVSVLCRWSAAVPPARIHVVTVPPAGGPQGLLWERFAGLLGIDPAAYDTAGSGANLSLGAAEVALLRRLNLAVDDRLGFLVYHGVVKHYLAQRVLAGRQDRQRIAVPPSLDGWVMEQSEELVEGLRNAGYDVVGDLDELVPDLSATPEAPAPVDDVDPNLQLDAAVDALVGLLQHIKRQRLANDELRRRVRELEQAPQSNLKARVRGLAENHPSVKLALTAKRTITRPRGQAAD
ncbi:MAG: hypothetical protein ACRDN9_07250 [Streptosporangiaceae bacterium]